MFTFQAQVRLQTVLFRFRSICSTPAKVFILKEPPLTPGQFTGKKVPWNGVMSMVDIDVGNLKKFLDGNYDTNPKLPTGTPFAVSASRPLKSSDIPDANGWVLYVSDRRGDYDFDGEYDMEDIYGGNDGILQKGEDFNKNTKLES